MQCFKIAELPFAVCSNTDIASFLPNLQPFVCSGVADADLAFTMRLDCEVSACRNVIYRSDEFDFNIAKVGELYSVEFKNIADGKCYIMEFGADLRISDVI